MAPRVIFNMSKFNIQKCLNLYTQISKNSKSSIIQVDVRRY